LVFDFDGLILDTEYPEFLAWQEVFAAHGAVLELKTWAPRIGGAGDGFNPYQLLAEACGRPIDRSAVRQACRARIRELLASEVIRPGVKELLADVRAHGLHIGLASSSPRSWIDEHLDRIGLVGQFDVIRTADDVRRTKPDPELYTAAVAALGVRPGNAIALEDSQKGVTAAKRAGLYCVAVPNRLTSLLPMHGADLVIPSLDGMRLADLVPAATSQVLQRRGY
jgi:HAD superfamily hydrolase (TIGR01509 family)